MGRPKTKPFPPQGFTGGQDRFSASRPLVQRKRPRRQRGGRFPIILYRSNIKRKAKPGSKLRLDGAVVSIKARAMQGKLASNLEAMEYAIDQAAIRLAKDYPLQMRKRLFRFVCGQFFSSSFRLSLQREASRWAEIERLSGHLLPQPGSTSDFGELRSRSAAEMNLALLFDCAFETRAQLECVRDFRCDLVQFRPGALFDPDLMRSFGADESSAHLTHNSKQRILFCIHGCLITLPVSEKLFSTTQEITSSPYLSGVKQVKENKFRGILIKALVILDSDEFAAYLKSNWKKISR